MGLFHYHRGVEYSAVCVCTYDALSDALVIWVWCNIMIHV